MDTRSRQQVIGELEEKQSELNVQLVTANDSQRLTILEDLNRTGRALAMAREMGQEVYTGKVVPSDHRTATLKTNQD